MLRAAVGGNEEHKGGKQGCGL